MQDINCNDIGKDNGQRLSEDSSEILLTTLATLWGKKAEGGMLLVCV